MTNQVIADACLSSGNDVLTKCDSAEPKSIDELVRLGVNASPAAKGSGSVLAGIRAMQGVTLYVTARSLKLIKDFRNFMWDVGKDGKALDEPCHAFSHGPDSVRYGLDGLLSVEERDDRRRHRAEIDELLSAA
jgi:phage terminase large subunit